MAKEVSKEKGTAVRTTGMRSDEPKPTKSSGKAAQAAAKPAAKKRSPSRAGRKKASRGDKYSCEVCGLVVTVDEECGCAEAHEIVCCGKEMKAGK